MTEKKEPTQTNAIRQIWTTIPKEARLYFEEKARKEYLRPSDLYRRIIMAHFIDQKDPKNAQ